MLVIMYYVWVEMILGLFDISDIFDDKIFISNGICFVEIVYIYMFSLWDMEGFGIEDGYVCV